MSEQLQCETCGTTEQQLAYLMGQTLCFGCFIKHMAGDSSTEESIMEPDYLTSLRLWQKENPLKAEAIQTETQSLMSRMSDTVSNVVQFLEDTDTLPWEAVMCSTSMAMKYDKETLAAAYGVLEVLLAVERQYADAVTEDGE